MKGCGRTIALEKEGLHSPLPATAPEQFHQPIPCTPHGKKSFGEYPAFRAKLVLSHLCRKRNSGFSPLQEQICGHSVGLGYSQESVSHPRTDPWWDSTAGADPTVRTLQPSTGAWGHQKHPMPAVLWVPQSKLPPKSGVQGFALALTWCAHSPQTSHSWS